MRMRGRWRIGRLSGLAAALLCVASAGGCGVFDDQPFVPTATPRPSANVLQNPGFENGPEPWYSLEQDEWRHFAIADGFAHSGDHSVKLELRGGEQDERTRIVGAVQRIEPGLAFPEFMSGYYYVDHWQSVEPLQYLQFVISIHGGNNSDGGDIHQVRIIVAGTPEDPFRLSNARYVYLNRDDPAIGQWTYFSYPVLDAVRKALGWDPVGWDYIETFFEARYDAKTLGTVADADVYYDDLYLGPQAFNPNRPPDE